MPIIASPVQCPKSGDKMSEPSLEMHQEQKNLSLTIFDIGLFLLIFIAAYLLVNLSIKELLIGINSALLKQPEFSFEELQYNGYFVIVRMSIFYSVIAFTIYQFLNFRNLHFAETVALKPLIHYGFGGLFLCAFLLFLSKFILAIPLYFLFPFQDFNKTPISQVLHSGKGVLIFCIFGTFITPCFEETVFRGFLYGPIEKKWGYKTAIWIITTLFILVHVTTYWGYLASLIVITPVAIVLTWIRARRGSIIPGIFLHILYNLTSFVLFLTIQHLQNRSEFSIK